MLYSDLSRIQNNQTYMSGMRPVLNKRALFSDMSSEFVCPPDPNPYSIVTIKFRAAKNNIDNIDREETNEDSSSQTDNEVAE